MNLPTAAFKAAISSHLSPTLAPVLDGCLVYAAGGRSDEITIEAAASALLTAMLPGKAPGWIAEAVLREVQITANGRSVALPPADAAKHPLVRDWALPSLGGAVAAILTAGAAMTDLAHGAPMFDAILITSGPRNVSGWVRLRFANADVWLGYGNTDPEVFAHTASFSGLALYNAAVEAVTAPPPVAVRDAASVVAEANATARDPFAEAIANSANVLREREEAANIDDFDVLADPGEAERADPVVTVH